MEVTQHVPVLYSFHVFIETIVRPMLFLNVTCFSTLLVSQCYLFLNVTCFSTLLVSQCYLFLNVTCFSMLLVSQCYLFLNVTSAAFLSRYPLCVCEDINIDELSSYK